MDEIKKTQANISQSSLKAGTELRTIMDKYKNDAKTQTKMASVFSAMDKDKNGVLDQTEIDGFKTIFDSDNNDIATKKEARKFIKENHLKDSGVEKKDVIRFLRDLGTASSDIESAVANGEGDKKQVTITYKNGDTKVVNMNKSYFTTSNNEAGEKVTEGFDNKDNLLLRTVDSGNKTTTTFFKNNKRTGDVTEDLTAKTRTETEYDDNDKPLTKITTNEAQTYRAEVHFDNGEPKTETVEETVAGSKNVTNFEYVNGQKRITSKVENKGNDALEKTTAYQYNDETHTKTETITTGNSKTVNTFDTSKQPPAKLSQTKTIDGKDYKIEYDGQGNTKGIIVQNGESISDIAKKFGVDEAKLKEVNADILGNKKYFNVGAEIKIPRELEADAPQLQGRKSAQEAEADFVHDRNVRAQKAAKARAARAARAARRGRQQQKELDKVLRRDFGLIDYNVRKTNIVGKYVDKKGKTVKTINLTPIGNATHGRTICRDKKTGNIVIISKNGNKVLKNSWVNVSAHRKIIGKYAVESRKDKHARYRAYDANGKEHTMSWNHKILKQEYVAKSDYADTIKTDSKTGQKATVDLLDKKLKESEAAFNKQMQDDGWAGDFADWVGGVFGSDNTADKVRADLKKYKNNIALLRQAAEKGENEFRKTFRSIYNVEYNPGAISNYLMHPTHENYEKAFGTNNDIGYRVDKYNESQRDGADTVKLVAEIGIGIAAVAAALPSGGTSIAAAAGAMATAGAATAAADVAVDVSDRIKITGQYTDAEGNTVQEERGLREGTDMGAIITDGLVDGAVTAAVGAAGKGYKAYKAGKVASKAGQAASGQAISKAESQAAKDVEIIANQADDLK